MSGAAKLRGLTLLVLLAIAYGVVTIAFLWDLLGSLLGHKSEDREVTDLFAGGAGLLLLVGGGMSMFWFRRLP